MKTGRAKKLLAFSLGALMLIGSVTPVFAANTKGQKASGVLSGCVDADWICNAGVCCKY